MPIKLGNAYLISGLQWYPESTNWNLQSGRRTYLTPSQQWKKKSSINEPPILIPDPWLYLKENALLGMRMIWPWEKMTSISTKCQLDLLKWKITIKVLHLHQLGSYLMIKQTLWERIQPSPWQGLRRTLWLVNCLLHELTEPFRVRKKKGPNRTFQPGESQSSFLFPCSYGQLCDLGMPLSYLVIVQLGWIFKIPLSSSIAYF